MTPVDSNDIENFTDQETQDIESTEDSDTDTSDEVKLEDENPVEEVLATTFEELLEDQVLIQVLKNQNILTPSEIQSRALPVLIDGKDAILQAQTGSGKTLAFVLPLIVQLRKSQGNQAWTSLVITPTRELALQIETVVKMAAPELKSACLIGGADIQPQIRALKEDARVVIGTPGRILDLLRQKELKLRNCRFFAVDEVDELLSTGFLEDIRQILSRLPDKRQGVFVSATVTPRVEMLAHSFLSKPARLVAGHEEPTVDHLYCEVGADLLAKTVALCDLVETLRPRSAIIFCNTKSDTQLVEALLRRRGFDARRINSDLNQRQRNRIMKLIRDQELQLLVATDVAARGIDIEQLDLVVNYTVHDQPESYVHRTGRTGRAGRSGRAISLIGPRDFGSFHHLTKVLPIKFEKINIPGDAEVADARLTHLYELLRNQQIEVKERDLLVARQLLREQGGIEEPSEVLESIVAKLCRSAIEHSVGAEAKSLDEEDLAAQSDESERESRPKRERQREERGRDRDRHGDRDDRGERRRDARGDSRGEPRGDARPERRDDRRDERGDNRRDNRRTDQRRDDGARPVEQNADETREPRPHQQREEQTPRQPAQPRQLRIFISQGTSHGMNPEMFASLASDFAGLPSEAILSSRFREVYGFIDMQEEAGKALIESLNGIEYNGEILAVEVALVKEPFDRSNRGRGHGGGHDRRSGGRHRGERDSRGGQGRSRGERSSRGNREYREPRS